MSRAEYLDLRDRIDDLRVRASADVGYGVRRRDRDRASVRFRSAPSSTCGWSTASARRRNVVEDRFRRHDRGRSQLGDRVLIPAGSEIRGIVSCVDKAGRVDRKAQHDARVRSDHDQRSRLQISGLVVDAIEGEGIKGEVAKIGAAPASARSSAASSAA